MGWVSGLNYWNPQRKLPPPRLSDSTFRLARGCRGLVVSVAWLVTFRFVNKGRHYSRLPVRDSYPPTQYQPCAHQQ